MKQPFKFIVSLTVQPILKRYLSKTRIYRYDGVELIISPEVFHPGVFFSTKFLLRYLLTLPLKGRSFLELGAGSGLISFMAAKHGAVVTASDINPVAIEYLRSNGDRNSLRLNIIHSDLFANIPTQQFDFIAINPPYYKHAPQTNSEHAWFCGENGEYFDRLFRQIGSYLHADSQVLMILSEECDLKMISAYAAANDMALTEIKSKYIFSEKNIIFRITSPA